MLDSALNTPLNIIHKKNISTMLIGKDCARISVPVLEFIKTEARLLLTFFIWVHYQSRTMVSHNKAYKCLTKGIHQLRKNWKIARFSTFYGKIWLVFLSWHRKNAFSNIFNTLTLKQLFLKTKPFSKTEVLFLVESTKILNATFPSTHQKHLLNCTFSRSLTNN